MTKEIFKVSFENYQTNFFKNYCDIISTNNSQNFDNFVWDNISDFNDFSFFVKESSHSDKDSYEKNFSNPLCSVLKHYVTLVVEKKSSKVCIKFFHGFLARKEGNTWYKKNKNLDYISVNTDTGDVYVGYVYHFHKKRKFIKSVRRNVFFKKPIQTLKSSVQNLLSKFTNQSYEITTQAFEDFLVNIDGKSEFYSLNFEERLFKFYLDKRGYKYPNNFSIYSDLFYGPNLKKIMKKNGKKIVDGVMEMYGLKGKKIKNALHVCTNLNLNLYSFAKKVFGEWISQENDDSTLGLLNSNHSIEIRNVSQFLNFVSKEELKKVYSLFKQAYIHQNLDQWTFLDHIRMYTELKMLGELNIKWKSWSNKEDFRNEHLDWTDKLQHYKMGNYYRIYPQYFYDELLNPIEEEYYAVILDNSSSYNEESCTQSNCVKGYIGKASSLIISLRKNSTNSDERATLEYKFFKDKQTNKIQIMRVQSLGKFNSTLSEDWNAPLLKLDKIILSYLENDNFETVKLTKECKNGVVLKSDSHFDDCNLQWSFKNIENNHDYFFNI